MTIIRSVVADIFREFRSSWKTLTGAAIAYKVIAFIVLTPLVGLPLRIGLAVSGKVVLADEDILTFLLGPVGWACLIGVGALWLCFGAIEQTALMAILAAGRSRHTGPLEALKFALANAWPVLQVTARIVALTLLAIAPFLVVTGAVYFTLLTEHDINYYLKERPPVFGIAVGIGGVIAVTLAGLLLRLFTGWLLALPLVLFEGINPSAALSESRKRATGHRRSILLWLLTWSVGTMALSTAVTTVVVGMGRWIVPQNPDALGLLSLAVGVALLAWAGAVLAVNLLSTTMLSVIIFHVYRKLGRVRRDPVQLDQPQDGKRGGGFTLTRRTFTAALLVGFATAMVIGISAIQSVRLEDNVQVMGHRGASASAPENTLAAVRKAIEDGADWVEIDVQETADGEVVVFHDSDFMRLSGVKLKIWDCTVDDLKDIDIGTWFAPDFKDERVPTLGDVLKLCKGKIGVNIELKYYGHDDQLEQRVAEIVEAHEMAPNIVVMSLKMEAVQKMKRLRPDWQVGLLMSVHAGNLSQLNADFVAVNADFANRSFVRTAQSSGKEVYVWTVNDPVTMSMMVGRGVDAIITDKPALARSVLDRRSQMSVPERLLMELSEIFGVVPKIDEQ